MDLSLPTVIGITTPGNKTVLRKGNIDSSSGTFSEFIWCSSSDESKGINSVSSSMISSLIIGIKPFKSKLSVISPVDLVIKIKVTYLWVQSVCQAENLDKLALI